jgi:hypothetical protein
MDRVCALWASLRAPPVKVAWESFSQTDDPFLFSAKQSQHHPDEPSAITAFTQPADAFETALLDSQPVPAPTADISAREADDLLTAGLQALFDTADKRIPVTAATTGHTSSAAASRDAAACPVQASTASIPQLLTPASLRALPESLLEAPAAPFSSQPVSNPPVARSVSTSWSLSSINLAPTPRDTAPSVPDNVESRLVALINRPPAPFSLQNPHVRVPAPQGPSLPPVRVPVFTAASRQDPPALDHLMTAVATVTLTTHGFTGAALHSSLATPHVCAASGSSPRFEFRALPEIDPRSVLTEGLAASVAPDC